MKGFGCITPGKEVGWLEKPRPEPGDYDVLVKPIVVAPCTSDVHNAFKIGSPKFLTNRIFGHEAVGEIVEAGKCVKDFKAGDKIVVPAITPDWRNPLVQDTYHQHTNISSASFKFAFTLDGSFAEYFIVPDADMNAAHLPDGVPEVKALMACDMMTTGFHGAELAEVAFGETVAVIGIGPVGLMAVAGAALRGAGRIIAVGSRKCCVEAAKRYGASDIVNYKKCDIGDEILSITDKKGVDKVILAGGDDETFKNAFKIVRPGGCIANLNLFAGVQYLSIPGKAWGSGLAHKTVKGGLCPGGRRRTEKMLEIIKYGRVNPEIMITHTFNGIAAVEDAFNLMANNPDDLIKPVVYF